MKKIFMFSMVLVLGIFVQELAMAAGTTGSDIVPPDTLMPGMIEGAGNHFEVTNSEYLNIVLDSSESITLRLESIPEMVTMHVEPASEAASTQITVSGFQPSTTYYKYEDNYHNLNEFTTDTNGSYSYTQDISTSHFVFIQPRKSTKFIRDDATGGDCYLIGTWDSATKTCTLTTDVYETIQIDSNYITLDGNGHTVTGTGTGYGVYLYGRTGVTIKNLNVKNFTIGIYLWYSSNNTLTGNTVSNNGWGIFLQYYSNNNTLTSNTTSNNAIGIYLFRSSNNILTDNTAQENSAFDLYVRADYLDTHCNNVIENTTGSGGRPIKFFNSAVNLQDEVLSELILCNADYSNINNIIIDGSATFKNNGLILFRTDYSNITNINSSNNYYGISLWYSSSNTLIDNTTANNADGINLWYSSNNALTDNTASKNGYGIWLYPSNNNTLTGNTISNNYVGIYLGYSNNNQIYNNNFITNTTHAIVAAGSGNIFNLEKPIGGNYWSNFDTPAEGCSDANHDGFCDAPYYFTGGADYLPWTRQSGWKTPADTTPPTTTAILSGVLGNNGWYISNIQITFTAVDNAAGTGVKEIHYSIDGGTEAVVAGSSASATINTEGIHTLTYYAVDNVGNIEQAKTAAINVDKTSPAVTITGISGGATYQFGMVPTPGYTVTDNLSGVTSSSANDTNDNGVCRITHTYTVTASDIAGNGATKLAMYYVTSTSTGVTALIDQMQASGLITNAGIANSLRQQVGNNSWNAFINHVNAQTGKFIDPSASELLVQAANIAMQC